MDPKGISSSPRILCFSSTDWESIWGSRQQVMIRFARKGYSILYIEQLAGLEHLLRYPKIFKRKRKRWKEGLREIAENLFILCPPPLLPGRYYSEYLNRVNSRIIIKWARSKLFGLNFESPILWIYKPEHNQLLGKFNESLSVYHCIDEWRAGTTGLKRDNIDKQEKKILEKVDLVFANSQPTYQRIRSQHKNTYRIPSGADIVHFNHVLDPDLEIHPSVSNIEKPIVAYLGTINERLNYEFLNFLAKTHPEYSLVFVGDTYPWTYNATALTKLRQYQNVHFPGNFSYKDLPSILKGVDVCLIPYVNDERGYYRSPLKLYEYLSAGKPVVSSDFPEAREFMDYLYIAKSPQEFASSVSQAISEDNKGKQQERIQISKIHSWDNRVKDMEKAIIKLQGN